MNAARGLSRVPTARLRALRDALAQGRVRHPPTRAQLQAEGLASCHDAVFGVLGQFDAAGARTVLDLVLAERDRRAGPRLELVWTGPEASGARTRDTAVVLEELFSGARSHVLLAGYSFDRGERILAPLHRVMREHGVAASIFLDLGGQPACGTPADSHAARRIEAFLRENWPFGEPRPAIYYDPRSTVPGSRASLHAKCVVVDHRRTLVTSANFTDRGQTRNIEAGVVIEDREFGRRLAGQWNALVPARLMRRYSG